MSLYVACEIEIRLYDDDVPAEDDDPMAIAQAVQTVIGHTGSTVRDVLEWSPEDGKP